MREAEGVKLEWGRMVSTEQAQAGKGLPQETDREEQSRQGPEGMELEWDRMVSKERARGGFSVMTGKGYFRKHSGKGLS